MSDLFLSPDELAELTGRRHKRAQIDQLRSQRIHHFIGADGRARVLREALLPLQDQPQRRRRPNFQALHGQAQKASS